MLCLHSARFAEWEVATLVNLWLGFAEWEVVRYFVRMLLVYGDYMDFRECFFGQIFAYDEP